MGLLEREDRGRLLYVLADGKLREQVDETTEGAKLRVVKDDDGNVKAEKWELTYPGVKGFITSVTTYDGDYGTNINISVKDANDEEFTLSLKANSKYGEDFLHKLPNVDFTKEITIEPKNYERNGKQRTYVKLVQEGVENQIDNAFKFYDKETKTWSTLVDGYPQPDKKTIEKNNSELWVMYYTTVRLWLIDYLTEKGLITESAPAGETTEEEF